MSPIKTCSGVRLSLLFTAGDFLLELLQSLAGTKKLFELFNFLINVMKYNAVYLKEEAVSGIIRYV